MCNLDFTECQDLEDMKFICYLWYDVCYLTPFYIVISEEFPSIPISLIVWD